MKEFISYCRFVTFNGEVDDLIDASELALEISTQHAEDNDEEILKEYAHKTFLKPHGLENEILAWNLILEKINLALKKFPTSLQDDLYLLTENKKEDFLSFN